LSEKLIAIRNCDEIAFFDAEEFPVKFALFPELRRFTVPEHLDLHELPEPLDPIDMELRVPDKIDLALFFDHGQDAESFRQNLFQRRTVGTFIKDRVAAFGIFLIHALIINEGILDIPFAKLESSFGNTEIGIELAVETFKPGFM
jgi:hypothetical protein